MKETREGFLLRLHTAGVSLAVDGARLRYRGPAGAIAPGMLAALEEIKADLVIEYHERAGILEYEGHLPRAEAEFRAAALVLGPAATLSG